MLRVTFKFHTLMGSPEGVDEIPDGTDLRETDGNAQTTTRCIRGKMCENSSGLKIHQSRMKCLVGGSKEQRTGIIPGKTEEVRARNHSTEPRPSKLQFHLLRAYYPERSSGPPANNKRAWMDFDADIRNILRSSSKGDADKRLKFMTKIIYTIASDRFGCVEPRQPIKNYSANHRVIKIKELRKELRSNKKQYKKAKAEERQPLEELRIKLREKLKTAHFNDTDTSPAFWLGRLAFVSDGVSKPMADSRPKGPQLRLGHPRVGELHPLSPMYGTRPCCLV